MERPEVPWAPCPCRWLRWAPRGRQRPRSPAAPAHRAHRCAGRSQATRSSTWTRTIWLASLLARNSWSWPRSAQEVKRVREKPCLPCAPNSWMQDLHVPLVYIKPEVGTTNRMRFQLSMAGGEGGCPAQETSALNLYLMNLIRPSMGPCLFVFLKVRGLTPNLWTTSI